MVPANSVLRSSPSLARGSKVLDHVFVRFILRIHPCLCSLDRQAEGVCDDDRRARDVAEHEAHDFDVAARAGVGSHLEEGESGNTAVSEEGRVALPWFGSVERGI